MKIEDQIKQLQKMRDEENEEQSKVLQEIMKEHWRLIRQDEDLEEAKEILATMLDIIDTFDLRYGDNTLEDISRARKFLERMK